MEDELYRYMENNGLSRWNPYDLATMARAYGLVDNFTTRGTLKDIRKAIAEGRSCIIHGYFTTFGHIIVVRGYDQYGFFVELIFAGLVMMIDKCCLGMAPSIANSNYAPRLSN